MRLALLSVTVSGLVNFHCFITFLSFSVPLSTKGDELCFPFLFVHANGLLL
jgi:hypothetical protein